MQVEQILSENLKREYNVTIPAATVTAQVNNRLEQISKNVKLDGFRPGKVPLAVVKQKHGQRIMGEVLEALVSNGSQQALKQEKLRPAAQPKIEILDFKEDSDLKFKMAFEIFPEVGEIKLENITIERPSVKVSDKDVDETLEEIASQSTDFQPVKTPRAAEKGDAVTLDFKGFVDGEAFEGGEAKGHQLELGSNSFIPGFEDQLVGMKPGESGKVEVKFPDAYHSEALKGKDATFEVTVHDVLEATPQKADAALAKKLGFEKLDDLKNAVRNQLEQEASSVARSQAKKELFDRLDEALEFDLPENMVKLEFDSIWQQVEQARKDEPNAEELNKPEDELKKEYEDMARRRVKLGIALSEIGNRENLSVTQEEISGAVMTEARRYPGNEQKVIEFYQQNPKHIEGLKGPLLEEKVVDYILENITVKETNISLADFRKQQQEEPSAPAKKSAAKKQAAAKTDKKKDTKKAPAKKKSAAKK